MIKYLLFTALLATSCSGSWVEGFLGDDTPVALYQGQINEISWNTESQLRFTQDLDHMVMIQYKDFISFKDLQGPINPEQVDVQLCWLNSQGIRTDVKDKNPTVIVENNVLRWSANLQDGGQAEGEIWLGD